MSKIFFQQNNMEESFMETEETNNQDIRKEIAKEKLMNKEQSSGFQLNLSDQSVQSHSRVCLVDSSNASQGLDVNGDLKQLLTSITPQSNEKDAMIPEYCDLKKSKSQVEVHDTQLDTSSFGMEFLFDEEENSDESSLRLEKLFDESIQAQEILKNKSKKKKAKLRRKEKRRLKRKLQMSSESDNEADKVEVKKKKCNKKKSLRPNYFIAVRVSNPEIHDSLRIVQETVLKYDPKLKPALIPLKTLHLTLMVMYLGNEDDIVKAKSVLVQCRNDIKKLLYGKQIIMNFSGLDHFRNEVLFSKVADQGQASLLKNIAGVVRAKYDAAGIPSTDEREFQPHLTVMKLSRNPKLRKKGIKKIPKESYSKLVDKSFGIENASALHLCSMLHKKAEDGFYLCVETANIFDECCTAKTDPCFQSTETFRKGNKGVESVNEDNKLHDINIITADIQSVSSAETFEKGKEGAESVNEGKKLYDININADMHSETSQAPVDNKSNETRSFKTKIKSKNLHCDIL